MTNPLKVARGLWEVRQVHFQSYLATTFNMGKPSSWYMELLTLLSDRTSTAR